MTSLLLALTLTTSANASQENTLHDFTMTKIDGKEMPLKKLEGTVVLVVNVASKCGLTPQYKGLQALYEKYKAKGFTVLAFPANQFGEQEPGSNVEINEFCTKNYGVTFPVFEKIVVKGDGIHPLYQWLLEKGPRKDDIEWNFAKFLIGRDGQILGRFTPKTAPDNAELVKAIEDAVSKS